MSMISAITRLRWCWKELIELEFGQRVQAVIQLLDLNIPTEEAAAEAQNNI